MCNQVEELKQLVKAWDAFFDARCQRIAKQDGHPAVKLWALSKYMRLRAAMRDILKEAVRHAEHAAGQA
jgi:hypothetical protein